METVDTQEFSVNPSLLAVPRSKER